MAQLQFGVEFAAPVTQTILPIVIEPHGTMYGFYIIPSTDFDGTETEFDLGGTDGTVPIKTVQKGPHVKDGFGFNQNTEQFMAAVWDVNVERQQPWRGRTSWVDNQSTGMYARWTLPTQYVHLIADDGALMNSFRVRLNLVQAAPPSNTPNPPTAEDAEMQWVSEVDYDALSQDCAFFDVNWFDLFKASWDECYTICDGSTAQSAIYITPLTAPPQFKVQVVNFAGQQTIAQGGVVFNTLRFIRVLDTAPGDYVFTFRINDQYNHTVDVTLTLTVVAP